MTPGKIRDDLADPGFTPGEDALIVEAAGTGAGGDPVAWILLHSRLSGHRRRIFLFGYVAPERRREGIGLAIMSWALRRAAEKLAATENGTPASIQVQRGDGPAGADALMRACGFRHVRNFDMLRLMFSHRPMGTEPGNQALPAGFTTEPVRPEVHPEVLALHLEAFGDHWGFGGVSAAEWEHDHMAADDFRPALSELARDSGGRLACYLLANEFPEEAESTGRVAWVGTLGVAKAHRRKGLASAMIERALARFRAAGFEGSMLGVDSDSLTGAGRIYARLGYRTFLREIRWIHGEARE